MCVCVCVCVCVFVCVRARVSACVDGMNLKYALRWHIHIDQFILCYTQAHAHTHILKPFEDREPTGLKVDTASF